jgi:hypothetical protein
LRGIHDFAFLHGSWSIVNRRLREPLNQLSEWYEFPGFAHELPLWSGQANVEEYQATLPGGRQLHGVALRLYEPETGDWAIHWASSATGRLEAPLTGSFDNGVGTFFGREMIEGRRVLLRFVWTHAGSDSARWEQAFSLDEGVNWHVNWTMQFTRQT